MPTPDLTLVEGPRLDMIESTVAQLLDAAPGLRPQDVLVVGARCRDLLHIALGHGIGLQPTTDLDLALALDGWASFERIRETFPRASRATDILFRVGGLPVDVIPFGDVEEPPGLVEPRPDQRFSVWAFREVHAGSLPLALDVGTIRIPRPAGYAAIKLAAWIDRAARGEFKDASDVAAVIFWWLEDPGLHDRLYDTESGFAALEAFDYDPQSAAAVLLGHDILEAIGADRAVELGRRLPDALLSQTLAAYLSLPRAGGGVQWSPELRTSLVDGLLAGLST